MKRKSLNKFQYLTRWFLLFSVLIGIFFSSGEGVHLLPFPVTTESSKKGTYPFRAGSNKSYTLSVHNAGNHSFSLKSNTQKAAKDLASGVLFVNEIDKAEFLVFPGIRNYQTNPIFYPSEFLISPSDRAPPVI